MFANKIEHIKIKIQELIINIQRLEQENEELRAQLQEHAIILEQKEIIALEDKKKIQAFSAIEKENKQFKINQEILQKNIDQMIKELEQFEK